MSLVCLPKKMEILFVFSFFLLYNPAAHTHGGLDNVWVGSWLYDSNVAEEALRGFGSPFEFVFPSFGSCWIVSRQKLNGENTWAISSFLLSRQRNISFWDLNLMLKDRIGTFFSIEAALPKKVVGKLIYVVTVGSWTFALFIPMLLEFSGKI